MLCAVMIFCGGCSAAEPLSPAEYKAQMSEAWADWLGTLTELVTLLPPETDSEDSLAVMEKNYPTAKKLFEKLENSYAAFEKITPPEEYKELHQKILTGVKNERTWLGYIKKSYKAKSVKELDKYGDKLSEFTDKLTDEGTSLPLAYMELVKQLKADGIE